MTQRTGDAAPLVQLKPSGAAAAAILSASIGSLALAVLTIVSDQSAALKSHLAFYKPTGPLSGVTTVAVVLWLLVWIVLDAFWKDRDVSLKRINLAAIILLIVSLLATFPPIGGLF